jgi:hypothetical protein
VLQFVENSIGLLAPSCCAEYVSGAVGQSLGHQLYVARFVGGYQYMWDTVDSRSPHNNRVENGCQM